MMDSPPQHRYEVMMAIPVRRLMLAAIPTVLVLGLGVPAAQAQPDTVYRWGGYSTVAWGARGHRSVPTAVPGLTGVVALAAGNCANYALLSNGQEWAWGNNGFGQLGNNSRTDSLVNPVQVELPIGDHHQGDR